MLRLPVFYFIICLLSVHTASGQQDTLRCRELFEKIESEADDKIWPRYNEELRAIAEKHIAQEKDSLLLRVYKKYLGAALNNEAVQIQNKGNSRDAQVLYEKALNLRRESGDEKGIAETMNNLGHLYHTQGNIPLAIDYYRKSLAIQERIHDLEGMSTSLLNLGVIFNDQGDHDLARKSIGQSLQILKQSGDEYGLSYALNNLAKMYEVEGNLPLSLETHRKSLAIREKIHDNQGIAFSLMYIGQIEELLDSTGKANAAEPFLRRSYEAFQSAGEKEGEALAGNSLAKFYQRRGQLHTALGLAQASLKTGQNLGYPEIVYNSAKILYTIYKAEGKTAEALRMHELYIEMHDIIVNENFRKDNIRRQFQYEYDRKATADSLKAQEERLMLEARVEKEETITRATIAVLILTMLFAGFVLNRFAVTNRQKKQIQEQHLALGEEKKKSDTLLLNILPEETAEEIKKTGTAQARRYESVSVLFSDFSNFTGISEKMSPEELVHEIHVCYSAFDAIISRYPIEKIKTIGDGYMCVSGLPVPNSRHAIDLVSAAREMQEFLHVQRKQRILEGKPGFEARMGIHSGAVVAGIVGTRKFAFDIWGDTVNIAARMEETALKGSVYVSEATAKLIEGSFTLEDKGMVLLKNKGEMRVYEVLKGL
ncbi:MAG: adenylate/guanylate cyclase domain-containing protein [Bacteroidia bacterium]